MKTVATSLAALALCLAATGAPAQDSRVSVAFAHPERYGDLRLSCVSRDADARALGDELGRFLQEAAARYPPRIDLQFRWIGADGAEVRAGTRPLRDSNYLTHAAPVTADHLRHENALLLDWLQRELRAPAGS